MNDNEGDRISELPDSVLHHILSFLDLKPAIQTSILSTKWRYVWKSLPFLNFDEDQFHIHKTKKGNLGFVDFVDNVLNLRDSSSSIQRFHLIRYKERINQSDFGKRLSRWITTALESNVQDMYMLVDAQIQLPQCLLNGKSLRKLELNLAYSFCYKLLKLPDSMNLPELKRLVLTGARFEGNGDYDITSKIISSCPVLESLKFRGCRFNQPTVDINAPQLKHLEFLECDLLEHRNKVDLNKYIVKLNAPNLISFYCYDDMFKDYCLVNVSSLVKAIIQMKFHVYDENGKLSFDDDEIREVFVQRMFKILSSLHNVETLILSSWFVEVVTRGLALLRSSSLQFCNLRCLKLFICHSRDCFSAMAHLLKISPNIESLDVGIKEVNIMGRHIQHRDQVRSDLEKMECDWEVSTLHHLKCVRISGVRGLHNDLQFLEILLKNGMFLKKVIIEPAWRVELSREFVQQLLTLPKASSSIEFLLP